MDFKRIIKVIGVSEIKEISYSVMFDRIEAGTYLVAAAVTEGNLKISNIVPEIIKTEINVLKTLGSKIMIKKNEVQIIGNKKIKKHQNNNRTVPRISYRFTGSNNGFIMQS
jgi:UDP-N-acetylglucosamine 1-carboxyvinyltransferase